MDGIVLLDAAPRGPVCCLMRVQISCQATVKELNAGFKIKVHAGFVENNLNCIYDEFIIC